MANTYSITVQDAHTRQSMTDTLRGDITLRALLNNMHQKKKLSIPVDRACIPGWGEMPGDGNRTMEAALEPEALKAGMPLMVYLKEVMDPRLRASGAAQRLFQEYPLVFFRKSNGVCIERIDFMCFGYEQPDDIVNRMVEERRLDYYRYRNVERTEIKPWAYLDGERDYWGRPTGKPRCLCELDPKPGTVFILEETKREVPPLVCLYGCPRAELPEQQAQLTNRKVDVICYED